MNDPIREVAIRELDRITEDLLYTEKAHFAAAESLRLTRLVIGLAATICSALAAASVIAKYQILAGAASLLAAALTAMLTFLKPDEAAQQHQNAGTRLANLRRHARIVRDMGPPQVDPTSEDSAWRDVVQKMAQEKADIDDAAPGVSERNFRKAQGKIARGDFEYTADVQQPKTSV
jgi:hypothetical protein